MTTSEAGALAAEIYNNGGRPLEIIALIEVECQITHETAVLIFKALDALREIYS